MNYGGGDNEGSTIYDHWYETEGSHSQQRKLDEGSLKSKDEPQNRYVSNNLILKYNLNTFT